MKKICLSAVIISTLFSSCLWPEPMPYFIDQSRQKKNKYYIPSTSNAPLLTNKNEGSVTMNHSSTTDYRALDFQASYVPLKHLGITASASTPTRINNIRFHRSEIAAGYILSLKKNWHFETYAGTGSGKIENTHATGKSRLKYNQRFIQPAIAKNIDDNRLQIAFVSRLSQASFKLIDTTFAGDRERYSADQIKRITAKSNHLFLEPGLLIRSQIRNFVFNINYTTSAYLSDGDFERQKNVFSLGMAYKFSTSNPGTIETKN